MSSSVKVRSTDDVTECKNVSSSSAGKDGERENEENDLRRSARNKVVAYKIVATITTMIILAVSSDILTLSLVGL